MIQEPEVIDMLKNRYHTLGFLSNLAGFSCGENPLWIAGVMGSKDEKQPERFLRRKKQQGWVKQGKSKLWQNYGKNPPKYEKGLAWRS